MEYFPFAPLVYIYNATIAFIFAMRSFHTYRARQNALSWFFIWVGLGVAGTFYLYGIPTLLWPERAELHGFLFLLSYFPLFLGTNFALLFVLRAKEMHGLRRVATFGIPLLAAILFFANLSAIPETRITSDGLIHWGTAFPYDILLAALLFFTTILPGILLLFLPARSFQASLKKVLLAGALIGGGFAGSAIAIFDEYTLVLRALFLAQFVAFSFLGSMVFIDIFVKEKEESKQ